MRFGIVTPVLTVLPRAHAAWEVEGRWQDVVDIAMAADRLGFDHLTCSEHVGVPVDVAAVRGGRYFDPLATFGYLAAVTERIRLATYVLVLGYHHPLEIAKRYGTLDLVSNGRLVLGVGVGSLREEFELLGRPFADRGDRADDALRAVRASLSIERPCYQGTHYDYDGIIIDPHAVQRNVPIWVGGRTARSLRRATAHADGWAPFGLTPLEISTLLDRARHTEAWSNRDTALDVVLQPVVPIDPLTDPDGARASLNELMDAGATRITLRFVHHSPAHYIEQLDAVTALGLQP
jgi:probable F420-dependent oxidoreductase